MADPRRPVFPLVFRIGVAVVATAGLVLLFVPGIARGLGRPAEVAPWALSRQADVPAGQARLLESAGLRVTTDEWSANRRRWHELSASDRDALMQRLARLEHLSADERRALVARYEQIRDLPRAKRESLRRQASALAAFERTLGRQDLALLDSLPPKQRARELVKLWRAARGLD